MRIPIIKDAETHKVLVELNREIENDKKDVLSAVTGNRSLLLYSPSKKVYEVTVTDAGALVITQVSG
jgi:hypothetical protein